MPPLANSKHEKFAQLVASGSVLSRAYTDAGYRPHDCNASRLNRNEQVRERIMELQRSASESATIDAAWVLGELRTVYRASLESGRYSSAVRSLELLGKSLGLFSESEPVLPNSASNVQVLIQIPDNGRDPIARSGDVDTASMLSITG